jgi:hypothetical protein
VAAIEPEGTFVHRYASRFPVVSETRRLRNVFWYLSARKGILWKFTCTIDHNKLFDLTQ